MEKICSVSPQFITVEFLYSSMRAKGQLHRFENKAQLLRHISEETGTDIEDLWEQYEEELE